MRLPRFRLRTLMIAVAVVGITLWSYVVRQRWVEYRDKAESYLAHSEAQAIQVNALREQAGHWRSKGLTGQAAECESDAAHLEKWHAYGAALARKYERAARYPWLPVPPDPPPPD